MRACAELPKLCEFFHIPFQAGDNDILRAMKCEASFCFYQSPHAAGHATTGLCSTQTVVAVIVILRSLPQCLSPAAWPPHTMAPRTGQICWTPWQQETVHGLMLPHCLNRRGYTHERYRRIMDSIRRHMPDASISGDAIVGFPGETVCLHSPLGASLAALPPQDVCDSWTSAFAHASCNWKEGIVWVWYPNIE